LVLLLISLLLSSAAANLCFNGQLFFTAARASGERRKGKARKKEGRKKERKKERKTAAAQARLKLNLSAGSRRKDREILARRGCFLIENMRMRIF
jgi:hypothetical protein